MFGKRHRPLILHLEIEEQKSERSCKNPACWQSIVRVLDGFAKEFEPFASSIGRLRAEVEDLHATNDRQAKTIDELTAENEALRAQKPGTCIECKWWLEGNEECRKPEAFHESWNPRPEHPCSECEPKDSEREPKLSDMENEISDMGAVSEAVMGQAAGMHYIEPRYSSPHGEAAWMNAQRPADNFCPTCGGVRKIVRTWKHQHSNFSGGVNLWRRVDSEWFECADPWHDAKPETQPVAHDRNGTALYVGDSVIKAWQLEPALKESISTIGDGSLKLTNVHEWAEFVVLWQRGPNAPKESPND